MHQAIVGDMSVPLAISPAITSRSNEDRWGGYGVGAGWRGHVPSGVYERGTGYADGT